MFHIKTSHLKYPLSLQATFNQIWRFFVIEKHEQAMDDGVCVYRDRSSACAIGCCIPDKIARKWDTLRNEFNDFNKHDTTIRGVFECDDPDIPNPKDFFLADINDLEALQTIHDGYSASKHKAKFTDHMKEALERFAERRKLSIPGGG
jgi:hypothetical protein